MCRTAGVAEKTSSSDNTDIMDEEQQQQQQQQQDIQQQLTQQNFEQEQQGAEQQQQQQHRNLPKWYPRWRGQPIYDGNPEVLGWILCSVAESIQYVGSGAFFVNTVLYLAKYATQCHAKAEAAATAAGMDVSDADVSQCGPTFGSIDPSSLLAMYATVIGVCSAMFLPLTGALIDYTRHRRLIGRISAALFVLFQIPTIFLKMSNYPIILSMHGCAMFVGWIQMSMLFAYLPELTDCEIKLASYTKSITLWSFGGMIVYLVFVVGFVTVLGKSKDGLFTNSVGMGTAFVINAIFFPLAWGVLFDKREPLHKRPMTIRPSDGKEVPTRSLFATGFAQLWQTAKKIVRNYRSLKWFYVAIAFSEAAGTAFSVIAITYMSTALQITATQNGIGLCIWLFGSIPGALLSTFVARRTDPLKSSIVYIVLVMMNVMLFSQLTAPGKLGTTYAILFSCGISGGWKNNMDRLVSSSIIPEGQDGEMMGFFLFAGQSLTWLPLIVFTAMNEAGIKPSTGIAMLILYLAIALISFCLIGNYPNARKEVGRETVYGKKGDGNSNSGVRDEGEEENGCVDGDAGAAKNFFDSEVGSGDHDPETNFSKDEGKSRDSVRTAATTVSVTEEFTER